MLEDVSSNITKIVKSITLKTKINSLKKVLKKIQSDLDNIKNKK